MVCRVAILDSDLPRGFWRTARITQLIEGKDGQTSGAILKVAERGEQATTLQRPLQSLYPLEVHGSSSDQVDEATIDQDDETVGHYSSCNNAAPPDPEHTLDDYSDESQRDSVRWSALKACERFKKWSAELLQNGES